LDKEVVDAAKNGDSHKIRDLAVHLTSKHLKRVGLRMRDINLNSSPYKDEERQLYVNAMHIAILSGSTDSAVFLLEDLKLQTLRSVRPAFSEKEESLQVVEGVDVKYEAFCLALAVASRNNEILAYLWSSLRNLWSEKHFRFIWELLIAEGWHEAMATIVHSDATKALLGSIHESSKLLIIWKISQDVDSVMDSTMIYNT
jgi:hypothetical protein